MGKSIPDELLIEILSRLPARSVVRFRCVCKAWLALMLDDHCRKKLPSAMSGFFYQHLMPGNLFRKYIGIGTSEIDGSIDASLSFLPSPRHLLVLQCCNGLLLCYRFQGWSGPYYLCNPATRRWSSIPRPQEGYHIKAVAFDPSISKHYSVVATRSLNGCIEVNILSSKTNLWVKSRGFRKTCNYFLEIQHPIYFNGILYFLESNYYALGIAKKKYSDNSFVLGINIAKKTCCRLKLPDREVYISSRRCLGVSCGNLHYAQINGDKMLVWVLDDYARNVWILNVCIDLGDIIDKEQFGYYWNRKEIMTFHLDDYVIFLKISAKVISYQWRHHNKAKIFISYTEPMRIVPYSPCYLENLDL